MDNKLTVEEINTIAGKILTGIDEKYSPLENTLILAAATEQNSLASVILWSKNQGPLEWKDDVAKTEMRKKMRHDYRQLYIEAKANKQFMEAEFILAEMYKI